MLKSVLRTVARLLCFALFVPSILAAALGKITPGATGTAPIGLSNFSPDDVRILSSCYVAAGGDLEIAVLFGTQFNPSDPWGNLDLFVKSTVPGLQSDATLTVTVYLDNGPGRRSYSYTLPFRNDLKHPSELWKLVETNGKDAASRKFFSDWNSELVNPFGAWVKRTLQWANTNHFTDKLRFLCVLSLEDDCPSPATYKQLLAPTKAALAALPITFRRNPNGGYSASKRVSGISYESHGAAAPSGMRAADALSLDGDLTTPIATFKRNQALAVKRGINCLFWEIGYNSNIGNDRTINPANRGVLKPFTGNSALSESKKRDLISILRSR